MEDDKFLPPPKVLMRIDPDDPKCRDVLIKVKPPDGQTGDRTPSDIVCVLDISGSMGCAARVQNSAADGASLTLLDVAKHGVKTVLHTLSDKDRLSVVLFDHTAEVLFELTVMDEKGKAEAEEKLKPVGPRGATNIWGGLRAGLDVCKSNADDSVARLAHLILLTDGQTADRDQVIPNLKEYGQANEGLPCTVSTFGFGYNIDSPLLKEMAYEGCGAYSFIPDAGFVGTVFVNLMSNLLVTCVQETRLNIDLDGASVEKIYGGGSAIDSNGETMRLMLGTLQFGQSKDVVLKLKMKENEPAGEDPFLVVNASYQFPGRDTEDSNAAEVTLQSEPGDEQEVLRQKYRLRFVETIDQAMKDKVARAADVEKLMEALEDEIKNAVRDAEDEYIKDLLIDITGEAKGALDPQAFEKWGKHYLPSLQFAHRLQMCNNFKDPGVQHYGGDMFKHVQAIADDTFNQLPPPVATEPASSYGYGGYGGGYGGSRVSAAPVSMAAFNDRCAG